jgi:hypothetical protein
LARRDGPLVLALTVIGYIQYSPDEAARENFASSSRYAAKSGNNQPI